MFTYFVNFLGCLILFYLGICFMVWILDEIYVKLSGTFQCLSLFLTYIWNHKKINEYIKANKKL